jgi:hypothetical protein
MEMYDHRNKEGLKVYISHGAPWIDFEHGDIKVGEEFMVGNDKHRIDETEKIITCPRCNGDGKAKNQAEHIMIDIDH